jgi:tRNA 2-thiouridine synthesizing protein E
VAVTSYAGRVVEVDENGFLVDSGQWTPEIAEAIAAEAGLARLTPEHWTVLALSREDSARRGFPPCAKRLCELTGLPETRLGQLFPGNAGALAARIAGLSRPPARP